MFRWKIKAPAVLLALIALSLTAPVYAGSSESTEEIFLGEEDPREALPSEEQELAEQEAAEAESEQGPEEGVKGFMIGRYAAKEKITARETPDREGREAGSFRKDADVRVIAVEGEWGLAVLDENMVYVPMEKLRRTGNFPYELGNYEFTRDTPILKEPREDAEVVGMLYGPPEEKMTEGGEDEWGGDEDLDALIGAGEVAAEADTLRVKGIRNTCYAMVRRDGAIYFASLIHTICLTEQEEGFTANDSDLIGHGGFSAQAPFNSAQAYRICGENGCYGAEGDLRMSKNGGLYMYHDSSVQDSGAEVCSFAEYLSICKEYNMAALIDLKWSGDRKTMIDRAYSVVQDLGMEEQVIWQAPRSMKICLSRIKELDADALTWYLVDGVITGEDIKAANALGCSAINTNAITGSSVVKAQDAGLQVAFYQTDSKDLQEKLRRTGVNYILENGKK